MLKAGWLGAAFMVFAVAGASAAEVGLVTAVSGNVKLQEEKAPVSELRPFVKVRVGDQLLLEGASRLQVVYFEGGRQETWQGQVTLEVGSASSRPLTGNLQPEIKTLPAILVKQLSKTPSADGNVKTGMIRMRSMSIAPAQDSLDTVVRNYDEMRKLAESGDRNPELYLLASYFEIGEFDRLEALLKKLVDKAPEDAQLVALNALYLSAINDVKSAQKR